MAVAHQHMMPVPAGPSEAFNPMYNMYHPANQTVPIQHNGSIHYNNGSLRIPQNGSVRINQTEATIVLPHDGSVRFNPITNTLTLPLDGSLYNPGGAMAVPPGGSEVPPIIKTPPQTVTLPLGGDGGTSPPGVGGSPQTISSPPGADGGYDNDSAMTQNAKNEEKTAL